MTDTHTTAHIPDEAVQAMPERVFLGYANDDNEHAVWTESDEGGTEYIRADISATHLSASCSVEVRKLTWVDDVAEVENLGLRYLIELSEEETNVAWYALEEYSNSEISGSNWNKEQAEAAAQADFQRRILSNVVTKPVDVAAVREKELEINFMQRVWANLYFDEHDAGYTFQQTLNDVVDWLTLRNALPDAKAIKPSAIRALSPAEPARAEQWQPIETAPKDGTKIDLWCSHVLHGAVRAPDARYHINNWVIGDLEERLNPDWIPTHWMPLPAAPTSEAGK